MVLATTCRLKFQGLLIVLVGVVSLVTQKNHYVLIANYTSESWPLLITQNIYVICNVANIYNAHYEIS